jgi:hypothetical protein
VKVGDLIRVQHFDYELNGKVGILMSIRKGYGVSLSQIFYSVRIPSLTYEIGLTEVQCEVIKCK